MNHNVRVGKDFLCSRMLSRPDLQEHDVLMGSAILATRTESLTKDSYSKVRVLMACLGAQTLLQGLAVFACPRQAIIRCFQLGARASVQAMHPSAVCYRLLNILNASQYAKVQACCVHQEIV